MQEDFGSVGRSLVFRKSEASNGGFGSSLRRSDMYKMTKENDPPTIRWRKGEIIGCGAYGRVYMGMNLDSGELLAVKQVLIAASNGSKEKAQAHIRELEEEVKLLRNLSHRNIVRYLGTAREDHALNILLEFVPGGSISSLLGKFGSFTEPVIRMYTKQLLQGLEYLHKHGIMHRDIKGANILVDNKGCIKLADFGASKQVVELATVTGAKSMKGTPYWMAPEVIRQTGHGLSADIWSVGCTVIEMATGKPPWSQQFQEVAALFHIGTTKSHPPIPDHLSTEAKDFLLKCLKKEPNLRPTATELLQHPFVVGNYREPHPLVRSSTLGDYRDPHPLSRSSARGSGQDPLPLPLVRYSAVGTYQDSNPLARASALERSVNFLRQSTAFIRNSLDINSILSTAKSMQDIPNLGSVRSSLGRAFSVRQSNVKDVQESNLNSEMSNNFLQEEDLNCSVRLDSVGPDFFRKSFNPISEPSDIEGEWGCKLRESRVMRASQRLGYDMRKSSIPCENPEKDGNDFSFQFGRPPYDDDDEVTESKIRAFLDEKALELKKLQTPLYEEFYNTMNAAQDQENDIDDSEGVPTRIICNSPSKGSNAASPDRSNRNSDVSVSSYSPARAASGTNVNPLREVSSPRLNEWRGLIQETQPGPASPSFIFSERQRIWKEELDQELEKKREEMKRRLAANGGKTSSPKDKLMQRHRDRSACPTPPK
ncbi:hypothetical protein KI387_008878 [Taxus chinensis]|uniref:mitogen-activated protein kinase kinase kinase n=1 Tax=Taxus chinensis TaxID=29808 RepID=A0AA38CXS5_TAXCH|nr:hypothetical protein KI387_008878 [Taxus chinensis]